MLPKSLQEILAKLMIVFYLQGHPNDQIVRDINTERGKEGLGALYQNEMLQESATNKANDLQNQQYWEHTNPQGQTAWDLMKNVGYEYTKAGENLARGYNNQDVIQAWMNSPEHKSVILNPNYKDIGTGTNGEYMVQHFGKTKKPTIWDYILGRIK